jgi:hypothetical protein
MADGFMLLHDGPVVLHPAVAYPEPGLEIRTALLRCLRALGLWRLNYGFGIEGIAFSSMCTPSLIEEKPGQFQVPPLTGGSIQFDQGQLDFLVPVNVIALAKSEDAVDVVGEPLRCVKRLGIPGEPMVLDGHLEEVSRVVHLVLQTQVIPFPVEPIDNPTGD